MLVIDETYDGSVIDTDGDVRVVGKREVVRVRRARWVYCRGATINRLYCWGATIGSLSCDGTTIDRLYCEGATIDRLECGGATIDRLECEGATINRLECGGATINRLSCEGATIGSLSCVDATINRLECGGATINRLSCGGATINCLDCDGATINGASTAATPAIVAWARRLVADIDARLLVLDMASWHGWEDIPAEPDGYCGTTHCIAGGVQCCVGDWATEPEDVLRREAPGLAWLMYMPNEVALRELRRIAGITP